MFFKDSGIRELKKRHLLCCFTSDNMTRPTRLENVRQLNIRQGKKLGFKLSQRQPLLL